MQERIRHGRGLWALVAVMALVVTAFVLTFTSPREASAAGTSLLQGKTVTVSAVEADTQFNGEKLVDGDTTGNSRWATGNGNAAWAMVDMGTTQTISSFRIVWEGGNYNGHASHFAIYVSETAFNTNDSSTWGTPVYEIEDNSAIDCTITLNKPVQGQYVLLSIPQNGWGGTYQSISAYEFQAFAPESTEPTNLAVNKLSASSSNETATLVPGNAFDGDTSATKAKRWSSENRAATEEAPHWISVDLGSVCDLTSVKLFWERQNATAYKIQVSSTGDNLSAVSDWTDVYTATQVPENATEDITLPANTQGRFVRLYVTGSNDTGASGYSNVALYEMEVYGTNPNEPVTPVQNPQENVALRKQTYTKDGDVESGTSFDGSKAVDGDNSTRWSTSVDADPAQNGGPHWIVVDLGAELDVNYIRLNWHQRKAYGYRIDIASGDSVPGENDNAWKTIYDVDGHPATLKELIEVSDSENGDAPYKARYVRLYVEENTYVDPDGGTDWGCLGLNEIEVYGGRPAISLDDVAGMIVVKTPEKNAGKLEVTIPEVKGFDVEYRGTDYEQVVDGDYNIHTPLVDKEVKLAFKVTSTDNSDEYVLTEKAVTIPGSTEPAEDANAAPSVVPELAEWSGGTGHFTLNETTQIIYTDASLKTVVDLFASDLSEVTGNSYKAEQGTAADGAIVFTVGSDNEMVALGEEGYKLSVTANRVTVTASNNAAEWDGTTSANWGAQTLLQAFESGDNSIPVGEARDYPLYPVRGIILDVGRKTFTLDWLEQVARQMAYYKLNDLNVHLNDNLIPIENYVNQGIDPALDLDQAPYSGFRLESTITEGKKYTFDGKSFTARTDLTSKDVWYSKADFKNYIEEFAELGVNISPEIDMPAHSLAFTKVFPILSYGPQHRNRDHLDILNQYKAVIDMANQVWDEYLGDDLAFSGAKYINIGADEFNVSGNGEHAPNGQNVMSAPVAYRKFVNDMSEYVLGKGYTPRVWGSLTNYAGDNSVIENPGKAQVLLWNTDYANMDQMYELGYQMINCNDGQYYIVPGATYYYDYLNTGTLYNTAINTQNITVPAGDPQMVGGMYAVWNDMIDINDIGISEYDVWDRMYNADNGKPGMGLFAAKLWGKPADAMSIDEAQNVMIDLGTAPGVSMNNATSTNDKGAITQLDMNDTSDSSNMDRGITINENAEIVDLGYTKALELKGDTSYANLKDIEYVGLGSSLRMKVMRTTDSTEPQVLLETPYGSGTNALMAVQNETGMVGFTREGYEFSFNYELPVNVWVELEFKNTKDSTSLFVNGKLVDTIGTGTRGQEHATLMFPIARIGSAGENAFVGYVDDVYATTTSTNISTSDYVSTADLMIAAQTAQSLLAEADEAQGAALEAAIERAHEAMENIKPDASSVSAAKTALETAIAGVETEKADYSRVEKLLALVPNDKSLFTEETYEILEYARDIVVEGLPATMQETVDGFEKTIALALDGLVTETSSDLTVIDPARLTATACSQEGKSGNEGPASNVLDGNTNTIWHTRYSNSADNPEDSCAASGNNHWITLATNDSQSMVVEGLKYTPRSGGGNGNVTGYEIHVQKTQGGSFVKVADGQWTNNGDVKVAELEEEVECYAVKLVVTSSHSNNTGKSFASAAEIRLLDGAVQPDFDGLTKIYDQAVDTDTSNFVEGEATQELADAIAEAKQLLDRRPDDPNAVYASKTRLADALTALTLTEKGGEDPEPEPTTYTVTFIGAQGVADQTVEAGKTATEPMVTAPAGYTFGGWFLNGEKYDFNTPVNSNITLTASWTLNAPTVSLTADQAAPVEGDTVTLTATAEHPGTDVTLTCTWAKDGTTIDGETGSTLAVTEGGTYTVTVTATDLDNATATATDDITVTFTAKPDPTPGVDYDDLEAAIEAAENLKQADYTPETWADFADALVAAKQALSADNQEKVNAALAALQAAKGNLEKVTKHTVTFVVGFDFADVTAKVVDGEAVVPPTVPTKDDWKFVGWFTQLNDDGTVEGEYDLNTPVTDDLTLYGGWIELTDEPSDPDKPGTTEPEPTPVKPGPDDTVGGDLAQTGDPTSMVAVLATALVGAGALVASRKRR